MIPVISLIHLLLLVLAPCLDNTSIENPLESGLLPGSANALGVKTQFFP